MTTIKNIWNEIGICLGTWSNYQTSRETNPIKIQFTLDNSKMVIDERKNGKKQRLLIRKIDNL